MKNVKLNFDLYHIQPVAYGGNNDYSNFIPLPKTFHKTVNSWWRGYGSYTVSENEDDYDN